MGSPPRRGASPRSMRARNVRGSSRIQALGSWVVGGQTEARSSRRERPRKDQSVHASTMTAKRLEGLLASAERPVTITHPAAVGATVEAEDLGTGRVVSYSLVGPDEARPALGLLSVDSPVGAALRGCCAGEEVVVGTPRGDRRLRIISVSWTI